MKHIITFILGLNFCFGQIHISDNFTDSNITESPIWFGDTSSFIVNSDFTLQLMANSNPSPQELYIISEVLDSGVWEFYCEMDFNPSSQNYLNIILNEDSNFNSPNQIRLELGKTSDKIRIYSDANGISTLMSETTGPVLGNSINPIWGKLSHINSNWNFEYSTDSITWSSLPNFNYNSNPLSSFGFQCKFTTTRKDKFFFDDISIKGYAFLDTISPRLISFTVLDSFKCQLIFNEPLLPSSVLTSNINIKDLTDIIKSVNLESNSIINLEFKNLEPNINYLLELTNIKDLNGNTIKDTNISMEWQKINLYNLQFSEIMIDPSPPVYLPEVEFIEIKNTTTRRINIDRCKLVIGEKYFELPNINIEPDSFLAFYSENSKSIVDSTQNQIFLTSNLNLPNTNGSITFKDSNNTTIHHILYNDTWYNNINKQDGGWSLININFEKPCCQKNNWTSSVHEKGGSPGRENSIIENTVEPSFQISSFASSDSILLLEFPFTVLEHAFINKDNFNSELSINKINLITPFITELVLDEEIQHGISYTLELSPNLQPCFDTEWSSIAFGLTSKPKTEDIILSEIKFNTSSDYSEYLEFKIQTNSHIDLFDLAIGIQIDTVEKIILGSNKHYFIEGNTYFVLCKDIEKLASNYPINPEARYFELENWQTLPDDISSITLYNRNQNELNNNCYEDSWHSVFLTETENVALEKIDLHKSGCEHNNWASASTTSNYGTPGFENSQSKITNPLTDDFMTFFSPNNDGVDDFWNYKIEFSSSENIIDAYILDLNGNTKLTLAKRASIGTTYSIHWDGRDEDKNLLPFGTYIIVINKIEANNTNNLVKRAISIVKE